MPFVSEWNALDALWWSNDINASGIGKVGALGRVLDAIQEGVFAKKPTKRRLKWRLHPYFSGERLIGRFSTRQCQISRADGGSRKNGDTLQNRASTTYKRLGIRARYEADLCYEGRSTRKSLRSERSRHYIRTCRRTDTFAQTCRRLTCFSQKIGYNATNVGTKKTGVNDQIS